MDFLSKINRKFGTYRGMIRLAIETIKMWLGHYSHCEKIDWSKVERLVFVCQGNICRSPYGHILAKNLGIENVASFGYATTTGRPAAPQAIKVAKERGISLNPHLTTDINNFEFLEGDLLLVMESRHLSKVAACSQQGRNIQVTMLGLWRMPRLALLYDPHNLSDEYFHQCYVSIENATVNAVKKYQASRQG
ncbi:hypothetical protein A9Q98_15050 [Thalassotalea sp. 42_200_T64]|nr:hypothetical protein A9Q98_15050 [Thalassotalea sp. 42_200_T64]